jgi:hypothetical protein
MASNQPRRWMRHYSNKHGAAFLVTPFSDAELHAISLGYTRQPEDVRVNESQIPLRTVGYARTQNARGEVIGGRVFSDGPAAWIPLTTGLRPEPIAGGALKCVEVLLHLTEPQEGQPHWPTPDKLVGAYWFADGRFTVASTDGDVTVQPFAWMPWP